MLVLSSHARQALAALAAAAAVLAGVTGCSNLHIADASSSHSPHAKRSHHRHAHHHKKHHAHARAHAAGGSPDKLVTEPNTGFWPAYRLIRRARHSIDLTMYELADTTAEHDLAAARKRGVDVRVLLDQHERSLNSGAYRYLRDHQVKVAWSWSKYTYTHQKTLVADGTAVIMTANLTSRYYKASRDFLVIDTSRADVSAIRRVFDADYAHRAVTPGDGRDLVWSPTDSQRRLLSLIGHAKHSLRVYSEEMGDTTMEDALIRAAKRGVSVRVCGENTDGEYDSAFARLARAGIKISYYDSPDGFYIHGKVIEADYGTGRGRVFIGSENFSSTSLNQNRELGLIISQNAVLSSIARSFATDFRNGRRFK